MLIGVTFVGLLWCCQDIYCKYKGRSAPSESDSIVITTYYVITSFVKLKLYCPRILQHESNFFAIRFSNKIPDCQSIVHVQPRDLYKGIKPLDKVITEVWVSLISPKHLSCFLCYTCISKQDIDVCGRMSPCTLKIMAIWNNMIWCCELSITTNHDSKV